MKHHDVRHVHCRSCSSARGTTGPGQPDLLRELLTTFINALMSAEADAVCGAAYGTVSEDGTDRQVGFNQSSKGRPC
jgi:transposase-like protein